MATYRIHDPGIPVGHPDFLPSVAPGGELCGEECRLTTTARVMCTRPADHDGDHAAHMLDREQTDLMAVRWPQVLH